MRTFALQRSPDQHSVETSLIRTLKPHSTPVVVLAVDRTSTLLATGGTDGVIKVWDIAAGYVTHTFRGPSVLVSALHFFELASHATDGSKAGKASGGKKGARRPSEAEDGAEDAGIVPRYRLASGSQDGKVRVWNLHKRGAAVNLDSHVSDVQALAYSPEQHSIVSASRDKTIIWWDAKSWKIRKIVPCFELVETVGFLDDGYLTFSAGSNGVLRIWNTETGSELTQKEAARGEEEAIILGIYQPSLPFILCVQVDHTLALYEPPRRASLPSHAVLKPFRRISGTHDEVIDLAYVLPDSSILALATNSEDVRLVSVLDSGAATETNGWTTNTAPYFGQDLALLRGHEDIVITLAVDWSGFWIATGAKDNTARLWRVDPENNSYLCWATFTGHAESLGAVALPHTAPAAGTPSHTNPRAHPPTFLLTGSQDQTIKKWEIPRKGQEAGQRTGPRAVFTRKAHDKDINAVSVDDAGRLFASASQDKTVKIWSVEEGEVQGILRGHKRGVWSVQFSPANLPTIQGDDGPAAGKGVVITGSGDKSVKLWSLRDYSCIRTFEGHANSVLKVAWLQIPTGDDATKRAVLFASAGGDGLVKVWNANSGEAECTLDNHEDRVWALAVEAKSNTIVSGAGDSKITFWKDTTAQNQAAASQAALEMIEQEQELQNHIQAGSYREAITLALQLNHPSRLLGLFTSVVMSDKAEADSLCGLKAVDEVLANLSDEQIFLLLLRLRDWNTNARTAPVAQRILSTLVRSYPASKLSSLSAKGLGGRKSVGEIVHGLRVYTERHYRRMEELMDESYLMEYTLQEMDSFAPGGAVEGPLGAKKMGGREDVVMEG